MNRTSLCIQMLILLKARGLMNSKQLAAALETKERNIREFKKELIVAGYNIQEKKGRYGGYYLDEESLFPALKLTTKEMAALQEAREMISNSNALHFSQDLDRAIDKVLNTVKDTNFTQRKYLNGQPVLLSKKEKEMIDIAQEALQESKCIELTYTSRKEGKKDTFLVDPYEILHYRNAYYVLGFSHKRNDYRMYRFSQQRMSKCIKSERKFLRDSQFHIEQHIGKHSLIKGKFHRVKVKVDSSYTALFEEVNWGMDLFKENNNIYSFLIEDLYSFYQQVYTFHQHIEIVEPSFIREEYIETLEKTLNHYKK